MAAPSSAAYNNAEEQHTKGQCTAAWSLIQHCLAQTVVNVVQMQLLVSLVNVYRLAYAHLHSLWGHESATELYSPSRILTNAAAMVITGAFSLTLMLLLLNTALKLTLTNKPRQFPLDSAAYHHWSTTSFVLELNVQYLLPFLEGTPYLPWVLRSAGARIGKNFFCGGVNWYDLILCV